MPKKKCECPIYCRFCGSRLRKDYVGHYCPQDNCQWRYGVDGCGDEDVLADKEQFVTEYLKTKTVAVDILNSEFVCDFIDKFKPKFQQTFFGAPKVKELGKLLSSMYKKGLLTRSPVGLHKPEWGFPKWVYCYSLNK